MRIFKVYTLAKLMLYSPLLCSDIVGYEKGKGWEKDQKKESPAHKFPQQAVIVRGCSV